MARAELPQAVPVEGPPFRAAIAAIDQHAQVTFAIGDRRSVLPASALVQWGECPEPARGPLLVLADGSFLAAEILSADKQTLSADSAVFGELKVPVELVAGVLFQSPSERGRRDLLLDRVAAATGDSDRVLLANEDEISGTIRRIRDRKIHIETGVGPVDVDVRRTRAVIYAPAFRRAGPGGRPHVLAAFNDGSVLAALELTLDEKSAAATIPGGLKFSAAAKDLAGVEFLGGRATYLSDIRPADYRSIPYLTLKWPYHTDRSVLGARLRGGGRVYLKGLGMHSAARLTYLLTEPFRRFQAELAIDDETGGRGSVGFRVFVDGRQVYTSAVVRGGQAPLPISVDLKGAKRLDLVIDFADRGDEFDHADWLDARLIR